MLSDEALSQLAARRLLQDQLDQELQGRSPGEIAATASNLAAQLASQDLSPSHYDPPVESYKPNESLVEQSQMEELRAPVGKYQKNDDLDTGQMSASTPSDLREHTRQLILHRDWRNRMFEYSNDVKDSDRNTTLQEKLSKLIFDENVPNKVAAEAIRANLITKFPNVNLGSFIKKEIRERWVELWRITVLSIAVYYRTFHKFPSSEELYEYVNKGIDLDNITKYMGDRATDQALSELGINSPNVGLSEKQLLALSMISSFTDARPLSQKLKSIGVKDWEFNTWLSYPKFQTAYRRISEDLLNEVQPVVNTALVQLATGNSPNTGGKPDLSAIKYLNEMNGRWDPTSRQVMDIRSFMTKVVDVLTAELSDQPEKLQRIGMKLAAAAGTIQVNSPALGYVEASSFDGTAEQEPVKLVEGDGQIHFDNSRWDRPDIIK